MLGACAAHLGAVRCESVWTSRNLRMGEHSVENPLPHLHSAFGGSEVYGCDCDRIAELAKRLHHPPGVSLLSLRINFDTVLDKSNSLMQDLPNHAAESMGDGPNGGLIAQPS